jgi:ABC-2 type transport system permease protein
VNTTHITAIAAKDFREARGNRAVWMPMLIVPLIFVILLPLGMILAMANVPEMAESILADPDMASFVQRMPVFISQQLDGLQGAQVNLVLMLGYLFAPFFLIIPLMFSTIIASESFAGERERKTIEALLYSPASDGELFLGKVLAAAVPSVLITWGSFLFYTVVVNAAAWPMMGRLWFPLPNWYPLIFWVTPAISLLGIAATVLISSRVQTFMGAYQSSASLVLLVIGLLAGQMTGILYLSVGVGLVIGLVIWLTDALLTAIAVHTFNREKLLTDNH